MTPPVLLAFLVLADFRLARLVTKDHITDRPRFWLTQRSGRQPWRWLFELAHCPWCVGVWAAFGLTLAAWLAGSSMPIPLLWPLAIAGGQAFLLTFEN